MKCISSASLMALALTSAHCGSESTDGAYALNVGQVSSAQWVGRTLINYNWKVSANLASVGRTVTLGAAPPGGFASTADTIDIFIIDAFGNVRDTWKASNINNNGWNAPYTFGSGAFVQGGGIAAASMTPDYIETFTIATNGQLWSAGRLKQTSSGNQFLPAFAIGPVNAFPPGACVAAVTATSTSTDTFVIGADGRLMDSGWWASGANNNNWNPGYLVPSSINWVPGGGVAAMSLADRQMDTFTIGNEGALWDAGWWDGSNWHPPYKISPANLFTPGAPLAAQGGVLYAVGVNGSLWVAASFSLGAKNQGWATNWNPGSQIPTSNPNEWGLKAGIAASGQTSMVGLDGDLYQTEFYAPDPPR